MTVKILSVPQQYEIHIPDSYIIRDDSDFLAIEIPNGFNWNNHAKNCKDCNAFLSSFGKQNYKWLFQSRNSSYLIDLTTFGKKNDHFSNLCEFENSSAFFGSRVKLKLKTIDIPTLETYKILHTDEEHYELCTEITNLLNDIRTSK
jgi:hypothetical protein